MEARVSLITLGVADLSRSRAFYEQLGFKASTTGGGDGVVFFQLGPLALSLFPRENLAVDARQSAEGSGFRGITLAHNVRTREEVAEIIAEAVAAGGRLVKASEEAFWGGQSGYFADPDGHLWEVAWNPFFPLSEDGSLTLPS
jgi:catechol 2,3-dioxygenase-like lactoylglutathione lyase family enzyme